MKFLLLVLVFCVVCTLLGAVGYAYLMPGQWLSELAVSELPLIGAVALAGTLYFFASGHPYPAVLSLMGAMAALFWITEISKQPAFAPGKPAHDSANVTVAQWSVAQSPAVLPWLAKLAPEVEVVVLNGLGPHLAERISHEASRFPYRLVDVNGDSAILSRSAFSRTRQRCWLKKETLSDLAPASGTHKILRPHPPMKAVALPAKPSHGSYCMLEADFYLSGRLLRLYTLHPPMPQSEIAFKERNNLFERIVPILAETPYPTLLVGDLSVSPYSPFFRSSAEKFGIIRTG